MPCNLGEIETIEHVLLHCIFCQEICSKFILPLLSRHRGHSDLAYVRMLLTDENPQVSALHAKLGTAACKIGQKVLHLEKMLIMFVLIHLFKLFLTHCLRMAFIVMMMLITTCAGL